MRTTATGLAAALVSRSRRSASPQADAPADPRPRRLPDGHERSDGGREEGVDPVPAHRVQRHHQPAVRRRSARRNPDLPRHAPVSTSRSRTGTSTTSSRWTSTTRWGFGLWYAPLKNLNVGFYRTSDLDDLRGLGAVRAAPSSAASPRRFASAKTGARTGASPPALELLRTGRPGVSTSASTSGSRPCRRTFSGPTVTSELRPVFKAPVRRTTTPAGRRPAPELPVPARASTRTSSTCLSRPPSRITHSITVHGEVYPRLSKVNSSGVGWAVTVEKSLLRHRFAFFAGNMRPTTVDQYTGAGPVRPIPGPRPPASNVYIGFNLYRAWKFK